MSRVTSAPHDPGRGASQSAGECQHLDSSVSSESCRRDDTVFDGVGRTSTDGQSTEELEDESTDHGALVADGTRGHRCGPGISDIVGTVVVGIQHGEECANGEDVVILRKHGHGGDEVLRWNEEKSPKDPEQRARVKEGGGVVKVLEHTEKKKRNASRPQDGPL